MLNFGTYLIQHLPDPIIDLQNHPSQYQNGPLPPQVYADGYVPREIDFMVVEQHPTLLNVTLHPSKVSYPHQGDRNWRPPWSLWKNSSGPNRGSNRDRVPNRAIGLLSAQKSMISSYKTHKQSHQNSRSLTSLGSSRSPELGNFSYSSLHAKMIPDIFQKEKFVLTSHSSDGFQRMSVEELTTGEDFEDGSFQELTRVSSSHANNLNSLVTVYCTMVCFYSRLGTNHGVQLACE